MSTPDFDKALDEWRCALGQARVVVDPDQLASASRDTSRLTRQITALLSPESEADVLAIVKTAMTHRTPIYPVSTGRNWGYGSSSPVKDGCVLVDLSRMNRILDCDKEMGLVTLEPGVTQQQLSDFLKENELNFLVPVTGAGPDCSLLGNALERGYGITPVADHFAAFTRLRVVLGNGSIYDTPLSEMGGTLIDRSFKYGVGPYIDGLFTQSNFGVVTSMTISLAPVPEKVIGFFFGVADDSRLEAAVSAIRRILQQTQGTVGSINLMNRHRVLSMVERYPDHLTPGEMIPDDLLDSMAGRNQVMLWTGAGALYGETRMARAAKHIVKKELRGVANRLVFFTPRSAQRLSRLSQRVPGKLGKQAKNIFGTLDKTMELLSGAPSEIALPLSYWKSGTPPTSGQAYNPAQQGCGLHWYSPLVPMSPAAVREYASMVERVCRKNKVEPLITLTSVSDKCWDSTVPILFDPKNSGDSDRAKTCFRELYETGLSSGFVPYRSHVETMDWFVRENSVFWQTAAKIKDALDPLCIIAPGRYSLR